MTVAVYQIKKDLTHELGFLGYHEMQKQTGNDRPKIRNYELVWVGQLDGAKDLEDVYRYLNEGDKPAGYMGRSLSVGDVVVTGLDDGQYGEWYCDNIGWQKFDWDLD